MSFEKFLRIKDQIIISSLSTSPYLSFLESSPGRLKMTVQLDAAESIREARLSSYLFDSPVKSPSLMSLQKVVLDDTRGAEVGSLHWDWKESLSVRIFRKSEVA